MIIHQPEIRLENGEAWLSARIESDRECSLPPTLWYAYPERYQHDLSTRADPFLTSLLLIAQTLGEDIHLRGEVSPRLLNGVEQYQSIFHYWNPALFKRIQVRADHISPAPPPRQPDRYASLFSGGVDSFFTLYQGLHPAAGRPTWPLTHGLFMHGSPDIALPYAEKYQTLTARYAKLYEELGLELITARTNLMQFSAHRIPFVSFLEAPTVSCVLGLSPLLSGVLTPAGEAYNRYRLNTTGPLTTQLHNTESFAVYSAGGAFKRLQKVDAISHWEPAQKHLRVCFEAKTSAGNCSRCAKCMRTRMDLHILGRLDKMETLERSFRWKDYVRWGRWLETTHGWQKDAWNYCRHHRRDLLPGLLLGLSIGYTRVYLKRYLPERLKQLVFRYTAVPDPHIMHEAGKAAIPSKEQAR